MGIRFRVMGLGVRVRLRGFGLRVEGFQGIRVEGGGFSG